MLAKVPPKRGDGRSSFQQLGDYIGRHTPEREAEQERDASDLELATVELCTDLRHAAHENAHGHDNDDAEQPHTDSGPVLSTNCLSLRTAAAEMKAVADMNSRVKEPVYHVVLSWRAGEQPNNAQMFEAGREAMKAVGMEGHQYVFAAHRDTDHHHLHMMLNRVHPETYKPVYPSRDFYKLDRCMREIELRQGWAHDKGPFAVIERDGRKVIAWATKEPQTHEKKPTKARDMEEVGGQESLFSYARGEARAAVAALLKDPGTTWQDLHGTLARHGLELRPKGQGLAVHDKAHPERTPIKASDMHEGLGKGRLVKRLGEYQPPIRAIQIEQPQRSYDKHREPVRDPSRRDQAREERAQARARLRQQYDEWLAEQTQARQQSRTAERAGERARFADLTAHHKTRREQIRHTDMPAPMRKALYSVAAMEALQAREQLRAELDAKRASERTDRPQSFREWTAERAQDGDQAAISQLRGWAYADRRRAKELEKADQENAKKDGITTWDQPSRPEPLSPRRLAMLGELSYQVDHRTGDVHYQARNQHVFTDSGARITFSTAGATDREALAAGLALARQKFGQTLVLTGSDPFKDEVVRVIVEKRLDVRLADPALEARRAALETARDLPKPHSRERAQERDGGRENSHGAPSRGGRGMER